MPVQEHQFIHLDTDTERGGDSDSFQAALRMVRRQINHGLEHLDHVHRRPSARREHPPENGSIEREGDRSQQHPQTPLMPPAIGFAIGSDHQGRPLLQTFGSTGQTTADGRYFQRPHLSIRPLTERAKGPRRPPATVGWELVYEMPGISKGDVELTAQGRKMTVTALSPRRAYRSTLTLPAEIRPQETTASFERGYLVVKATFARPIHPLHRTVPVAGPDPHRSRPIHR